MKSWLGKISEKGNWQTVILAFFIMFGIVSILLLSGLSVLIFIIGFVTWSLDTVMAIIPLMMVIVRVLLVFAMIVAAFFAYDTAKGRI